MDFAQLFGMDGASLRSSINVGRSPPQVFRRHAYRVSQQA
jgi:hypothetical protein